MASVRHGTWRKVGGLVMAALLLGGGRATAGEGCDTADILAEIVMGTVHDPTDDLHSRPAAGR